MLLVRFDMLLDAMDTVDCVTATKGKAPLKAQTRLNLK